MAKCLVVDDSAAMREVAGRLLADLGHQSVEAESWKAAVERCAEGVDLVLLDWDLPAMAALDFLRAAMEFPAERRPVIVLCAAENDPRQFTLARAAGAPFHLLKPLEKNRLASVLGEAGLAVAEVA
jgi:two-component system chemotaxis response regulator CheY